MCLPVIIIPPAPFNISTRSSHQDILLTTPPASYKLNCRSANTNHFTNNNPKHTTTSDPQLPTHQKDEKKKKKKWDRKGESEQRKNPTPSPRLYTWLIGLPGPPPLTLFTRLVHPEDSDIWPQEPCKHEVNIPCPAVKVRRPTCPMCGPNFSTTLTREMDGYRDYVDGQIQNINTNRQTHGQMASNWHLARHPVG